MLGRRQVMAATAVLAAAGQARAQASAWAPVRPMRMIVPFGAGGPADIYARVLAERLAGPLGQPIVVENRPGAGATIGTDLAAKAAPDGHTLLMMSNTHTANETLLPNRPYVLLRDFAPVAAVNTASHVLVARSGLATRSLAELIEISRARPGALNFASSGPGTPYHIAGEAFAAAAGIQAVHVPFRSSGEARTAIIAGNVDWMFDSITTQIENIAANRVVGLATTGAARSPLLPTLPAVAETIPGFTSAIWLGVMAPAATPPEAVTRLNTEINRVIGAEETRATWARQAVEPLVFTPTEFRAFIERDISDQRAVIGKARITAG